MKSFSSGDIATICDVTPRTVIRWISAGRLNAFKLPGRGNNRVTLEDLIAFLEANRIPVPLSLLESADQHCIILSKDKHLVRHVTRLTRNANFISRTITNEIEAGIAIAQYTPSLIILDDDMLSQSALQVTDLLRVAVGCSATIILFHEADEKVHPEIKDAICVAKPLDVHAFAELLESHQ